MTQTSPLSDKRVPSRGESWRMFNRIASSYDRLNHLLALRIDICWRRRLVRMLPDRPDLDVLDLATGTGDALVEIARACPNVRGAVGMDMAANMLDLARAKLRGVAAPLSPAVVRGDATRLAVADASFDVVTIAFGVRNFADVPAALREVNRVLRPEGRALILEFSIPRNRVIRGLYLCYLRRVLTRVGGFFSGDRDAYRYLNKTIEAFPSGQAFCELLREAGFAEVTAKTLSCGIVTIYQGVRR